jgi:adenosylhomocysteine nucleosidase
MRMNTILVLISANAEWRAIREVFPQAKIQISPLGEWFVTQVDGSKAVTFFHGGWGKIAAAASTQYVIDRWSPDLLVNLGTCGGFEGEIERGEIVLANRTLVYDIIELMGDGEGSIAHYTTKIDLSWLKGFPHPVKPGMLVSADRDLIAGEVEHLKTRYAAFAGDWESGAIAYVAARNGTRLLILRGVTDLVGNTGGEAYGNIDLYHQETGKIMRRLVAQLPDWILAVERSTGDRLG